MLFSRIHSLKFISKSDSCIWVKRDDELGFGISGTKLRKYESLIGHIRQQVIKHAVLIGGAYSNNIVGLAQLLIENDVVPYLFLRGDQPPSYQGNFLLTSLLVPDKQIHWVKRRDWKHVDTIAAAFLRTLPQPSLLVPEGASMLEALSGSLSLGEDIVRNECEHHVLFDHIFIDAGTGLAAIGLILGLRKLERSPQIHMVLLAICEAEFLEKLRMFYTHFSQTTGEPCFWNEMVASLHFYTPATAHSFGTTNQQVFKTIVDIARMDGILTDPIYTAKLFMKAKEVILATPTITGNVLLIHGGGGLGLMGYQEELEKKLRQEKSIK